MATERDTRHKQVRRQIEMQICRDHWSVGQRIPGERELARIYGVSQMTVNRAIQDLVREGKLERRVGSGTYVCDRSEELNGEPSKLVLVVPYTDHPEEDAYLRSPFRTICNEASLAGCSLQVVQATEAQFPNLVDRNPGAAFLFAAPSGQSRDTLKSLQDHGVPFVVMGSSWPDETLNCVDSDNFAGARLATDYLLRLGHRRIGFLNGDPGTTNCQDRLRGYQAALAEAGVEADPSWVAQAGGNWEIVASGRNALTETLLGREPVTAIVAAGFHLCLHLLQMVRSLRLEVPADVSIISLDDSATAEHLSRPLTAMRQPLPEMGRLAAAMALSLLSQPMAEPTTVLVPMELMVRNSCERLSLRSQGR